MEPHRIEPPLCVDLDRTLVRTDLLWETLAATLARSPAAALAIPFWLLRGRAALKRELAQRAPFDASTLPYDRHVLEDLRSERARGRRLVLATAADQLAAERVAAHVGLFDEVIGSDGVRNNKGEAKARTLIERFGERGFDYVGSDRFDLPIWRRARVAVVARGNQALASRL